MHLFPSSQIAYAAAIGCSLCYGLAVVLEHVAAQKQTAIKSLHPTNILKLFSQVPYMAGIILSIFGWLLFILASRRLPLFLTLSFVSASLAVSAIIESYRLKKHLTIPELISMFLTVVGIVLIGVVAKSSSRHISNSNFALSLDLMPIVALVLGALALKAEKAKQSPYILALLSGISFGVTGLIGRLLNLNHLSLSLLVNPLFLALLLDGILGEIFLGAALQRASVNKINSVLYASELAIPSVLAIAFLHDKVMPGRWPIMVIGILLVILGSTAIAMDIDAKKIKVIFSR